MWSSRRSRPGNEVATWLGAWHGKRSRNLALRSRPGSACLRSQSGLEVGTWPRLLGHLVSRPGLWVVTGQAQLCVAARDCSLDHDDMYTNLKRYHQRAII